jgi:hypothetical protein
VCVCVCVHAGVVQLRQSANLKDRTRYSACLPSTLCITRVSLLLIGHIYICNPAAQRTHIGENVYEYYIYGFYPS